MEPVECVQCSNVSVVHKTDVDVVGYMNGKEFRFVPTEPLPVCETCGDYNLSMGSMSFMELHMSMAALWTGNISGETFKFIRKALGFTRMRMADFIGNGKGGEDVEAWELLTTPIPLSSSLEAKLLKAVVEARAEAFTKSEVRPVD